MQKKRMLKAVAARLQALFGPGITLARLGGDEFAVLLESCPQPAQAAALAQRILDDRSAGGGPLHPAADLDVPDQPVGKDSRRQSRQAGGMMKPAE